MAITSVAQRPHWISTPVNPMFYSVDSDKNEELDMFYVFDLVINYTPVDGGSTSANVRIKQRPNPYGYGMVDISSVVSSYINTAEYAPPEYGYSSGGTYQIKDFRGIIAEVEVYVGEEYLVDGLPTLFDGSGTEGDPAYELTSSEYAISPSYTDVKWPVVIPAALSYQESIESLETIGSQFFPFFQKFAGYDLAGYGYAMSEVPTNATWNTFIPGDYLTLTYWNQNPVYTSNIEGQIKEWQVDQFTSSGSSAGSGQTITNITSNGGGPATSTGYSSVTFTNPNRYFLMVQILPSFTPSATCAYITVTPKYKDSVSTTYDGQTYYFYVDPDCQDLYQRVRLSWLNKWGGRDYYNFTKFYEKSTNTTSDSYSQPNYQYSLINPVRVGPDKTFNWNKGGTKSFNRNTEITMRIESDWVVQEELDYLGAIPESSDVIAYVGDTVPAINPTASPKEIPYTVQITNLKYDYKLIKQQKLTQVSFDMTYTKLNKKQDIV